MERITHKVCQVCKDKNIEIELRLRDHSVSKEDYDIYKCNNCGFLFTQDAPSISKIGKYYQGEDYISHSDTQKGLMNKAYHLVRNIMLRRKYKLIKGLKVGKEILDIGCGTGYFLNYMSGKKYKTQGLEVDKGAREYGREKFGVDILPMDDFLEEKIPTKFSVITMWHVLEHIHDLNFYMQSIKSMLKKNGRLLIAVPNPDSYDARHYKSFWAAYDVPIHLWHFTPSTLELFAKKSGFKVVRMKRMPFDSIYNSMLSEKYKGNKLFFISGIIIGVIAILNSMFNIRKASSIIYILKKMNS